MLPTGDRWIEPEAAAVEMLDTEVLGELRGLGADDLRDLVSLYFADLQVQLERVHGALIEGDAQSVAALAHRMKGASLSIGAARLASLAAELETAGKEDQLGPGDELVRSLESELEPTRIAISVELSVELPD
jgi:HPt (histidine-containing phosphotransfer) domain-containing protein